MAHYIDPNSGAASQPGGVGAPATQKPPHEQALQALPMQEPEQEEEPKQAPKQQEKAQPTAEEPKAEPKAEPKPKKESKKQEPKIEAPKPEKKEESKGESKDRLDDLAHKDLMDVAAQREITGRHNMSRQDLIEAIRSHD